MDEFKRIKMSSLLILLLQFTGAAIGQRYLYLSVRAGDEATLPCNSVIQDQDECESTTWLFSDSGSSAAVELVSGGQVGEEARAKSDRLRVTGKCSLGIKKATEEDTGRYSCRQIRPGEQQGPDSQLYLSVVTMTEHQDNDETFRPQSSGEDTTTTTESDSRSGLLRLVLVSVGLAALIMIVVAVTIWTRTKEKQTQMDEINVRYDVDDGTVNYENIRPPDGV
ncbi:Lymphocyte antigen 6 complex locus protein G6f [Dissostichus eleginoides]|uniref:Lymphocyte antigen 6 complex locus protein G6f n=1 Tax=Dissostichus eleginoides TaxID=100907 RepID=A0AAD9BUD0_DISEL|nr:Lymphocyte antigen 6 complex locus protein G6f [Dissostichus eleginoides]